MFQRWDIIMFTIMSFLTKKELPIPEPFDSSSEVSMDEYSILLTDRIKRIKGEVSLSFLEIGKYLHIAHDSKVWKYMGYSSWRGYCENALSLSRTVAFRLRKVYEIFVLSGHYDPHNVLAAGHCKLYAISRYTDDGEIEKRQEWVKKATEDMSHRKLTQALKNMTERIQEVELC